MEQSECSYLRFVQGDDRALAQLLEDYKDGLIQFLIFLR